MVLLSYDMLQQWSITTKILEDATECVTYLRVPPQLAYTCKKTVLAGQIDKENVMILAT